eukprot:6754904-Pyramimonas_sp.AAC.1
MQHIFLHTTAVWSPRLVSVVVEIARVGTSKTKYPDGWELIEPTLNDLETKMREGAYVNTIVDP